MCIIRIISIPESFRTCNNSIKRNDNFIFNALGTYIDLHYVLKTKLAEIEPNLFSTANITINYFIAIFLFFF